MSKIKVTSKVKLYDGMSITFKAPCDCTAVDGLNVHYQGTTHYFSLRDAHGNDLAGVRNLFVAGTYVKVILDTASGIAYIQNADSNAYLENHLDNILTDETKTLYGLSTEAVPSDVFALLGKYNQHWWRRTALVPVLVGEKVSVNAYRYVALWYTGTASKATIYVADECAINQETGEVELVNPTVMYVTGDNGKYDNKWILPANGIAFYSLYYEIGRAHV